MLSAAIPSPFGDALGLLADTAGYVQDPSSLTPLRGALSLAGLVPGIPSANKWYHGGDLAGEIKAPLFLTKDKKYAEGFIKSHGKGKLNEFDLPSDMKVYPEPVWWQDFQMTFGGPSSWKKMGYDAVRVIEPNGAQDSLAIVNPSILSRK